MVQTGSRKKKWSGQVFQLAGVLIFPSISLQFNKGNGEKEDLLVLVPLAKTFQWLS